MVPNELYASGGRVTQYEIQKSLRFRSSSLTSLTRTPLNAGNRKTWTWSGWVKRALSGTLQEIFCADSGNAYNRFYCYFNTANQLVVQNYGASGNEAGFITNRVFQDVGSHYHIQVVFDTTNPSASDRVKLYVNSKRITSVTSNVNPSLNYDGNINTAIQHVIGNSGYVNNNFDGYLSEINFIDGQALSPYAFGAFNKDTRQWRPIKYSGTYGQNGYYLTFKNIANLTSLGYDESGNSNHWLLNNFSLTAGRTYDSFTDTPTNNFCKLNFYNTRYLPGVSVLNWGGLYYSVADGAGVWDSSIGNIGYSSGKFYFEHQVQNIAADKNAIIGFTTSGFNDLTSGSNYYLGKDANSYSLAITADTGYATYTNGVQTNATSASIAALSILIAAVDIDAGKIWFGINGAWINNGNPATGANPTYTFTPGSLVFPGISLMQNNGWVFFGASGFNYTPPSNFNALSEKFLLEPTVKRGEAGFNVVSYIGNGANNQIGEAEFAKPSYLIPKSLRFKGINSSLNRTPAAIGNQRTWTFSGWVKNTNLNVLAVLLSSGQASVAEDNLQMAADGTLSLTLNNGTAYTLTTARILKDTVNWSHVHLAVDTTQAIDTDRVKLWINGVLRTLSGTYPVQNFTCIGINYTRQQNIGVWYTGAYPLQGYLAEVYFIDGQALDPINFGDYDTGGYWIPKAYAGTYGQNGFYLDFQDTSSTTALGLDKSGRGNHWTTSGFSLTAGVNYDSMTDTPTNNMPVLNSAIGTGHLPVNAALEGTQINGTAIWVTDSVGLNASSGKFYFEVTIPVQYTLTDGEWSQAFGIIPAGVNYNDGSINQIIGYLGDSVMTNGYGCQIPWNASIVKAHGGVLTNIGGSIAPPAGETWGCAFDLDAGKIWFHRNGTWLEGDPATGANPSFYDIVGKFTPAISLGRANGTARITINLGQQPFVYALPQNFKALSIPNIAEYTYDIEQPDFVWIKTRNVSSNHILIDSLRGGNSYISSNLTNAETINNNLIINFNKNGFYLGNQADVNTLNNTYVAWMWKANQQALSITDGTIPATVKSNPTYGFSIVRYTGNGLQNASIGHGLNALPKLIIVKNLDNAASNWPLWHVSLGIADTLTYLNTAQAAFTSTGFWGNQSFTSQVFNVGTSVENNGSGNRYVAYCFSEIDGFSKFGKFIGNGLADGPFVYCGFRPRYVLIKPITQAVIALAQTLDIDIDNHNLNVLTRPSQSTRDTSGIDIDYLSNGFKIRRTASNFNTLNESYMYIAFADNPFKNSNAI